MPDVQTFSELMEVFEISFNSNKSNYSNITIAYGKTAYPQIYYDDELVYDNLFGEWVFEAYRTVTFEIAPSGDLRTWLQSNAVKQ